VYQARIGRVEKKGDTYILTLELQTPEGARTIRIPRLARKPSEIRVRVEAGKIIIDIVGDDGRGFATCILDQSSTEGEDCKNLQPH